MTDIRRLSEKSVKILTLIANGQSASEIVACNADISGNDISQAADEALRLNASRAEHADGIARIRSAYPKAYQPWAPLEDDKLAAMYARGTTILELATHFQRQPSAIRSRLRKLKLTSADDAL